MNNTADNVLQWYDQNRRQLPWRCGPDIKADPYHVWLSEIMLQQTNVATVKSYFLDFIDTWPKLEDLAASSLDDVLHAWQGLGYYARARNLHKCARIITSFHNGQFPSEEKELLKLPGIGPYTAAAIVAIAFDKISTPIDGNIERVISRLYAIKEPLPKSKKKIRQFATEITPKRRVGDYAQALMDIGSTICVPKRPVCHLCPLIGSCKAKSLKIAENLPYKKPKRFVPLKLGTVFWLCNNKGEILLRRRPENGLLGGMIEVPSSTWVESTQSIEKIIEEAPFNTIWEKFPGTVRHMFSHFQLELNVLTGNYGGQKSVAGIWCKPVDFDEHAFPTVMKKVIAHILG